MSINEKSLAEIRGFFSSLFRGSATTPAQAKKAYSILTRLQNNPLYQARTKQDKACADDFKWLTWQFQGLTTRMEDVGGRDPQFAKKMTTSAEALNRLRQYQSIVPDSMKETLQQLTAEGEALSPDTPDYKQKFSAFRNKALVFEQKLILDLAVELKTNNFKLACTIFYGALGVVRVDKQALVDITNLFSLAWFKNRQNRVTRPHFGMTIRFLKQPDIREVTRRGFKLPVEAA